MARKKQSNGGRAGGGPAGAEALESEKVYPSPSENFRQWEAHWKSKPSLNAAMLGFLGACGSIETGLRGGFCTRSDGSFSVPRFSNLSFDQTVGPDRSEGPLRVMGLCRFELPKWAARVRLHAPDHFRHLLEELQHGIIAAARDLLRALPKVDGALDVPEECVPEDSREWVRILHSLGELRSQYGDVMGEVMAGGQAHAAPPPIEPLAEPVSEKGARVSGGWDNDETGPPAIPARAETSDENDAAKAQKPDFTHADDFTWVIFAGHKYDFTKGNQAESIRALWESWERSGRRDGCGMSEKVVGEKAGAAGDNFRLAHVFRSHPAWSKIIRPVSKGVFALFASESPKNPTC